LALTFLIVLAHFATYTYVTPFLAEVTHASPALITALLLLYGIAGLIGNFLAGGDLDVRTKVVVAASLLAAAATTLLPVFGRTAAGAVVLLIVWGLAYGAVPGCSQTWFTQAAPHAPEAASVLFTSSFQATLSLGALAGGVVGRRRFDVGRHGLGRSSRAARRATRRQYRESPCQITILSS
jgi:predicted MFS family arabinose efflux permease